MADSQALLVIVIRKKVPRLEAAQASHDLPALDRRLAEGPYSNLAGSHFFRHNIKKTEKGQKQKDTDLDSGLGEGDLDRTVVASGPLDDTDHVLDGVPLGGITHQWSVQARMAGESRVLSKISVTVSRCRCHSTLPAQSRRNGSSVVADEPNVFAGHPVRGELHFEFRVECHLHPFGRLALQ